MPERIQSNTKIGHESLFPREEAVKEESGEYRGETVTLNESATSIIEDIAEEITFSASEIVEKKISRRKVKSKGNKDPLKYAEFYLKKLPDIGKPEKFQEFVDHLKKKANLTAEQLSKEVEKFSKDVSHQYVALSFARDLLEGKSGFENLKSKIDDLIDDLYETNGPEIRAGLNVTETATEFSRDDLFDVQALRDFYRDTVLQYEGITETFKSIVEKYGGEKFDETLDFLLRAIGSDLHSQGPSTSTAELKKIVDDLYQVEVLGTIHKNCEKVLDKLETVFNISAGETSTRLTEKVLNLREKHHVQQEDFIELVNRVGIVDQKARVYFMRELKNIISLIPLKVYENQHARFRLMDAAQGALDVVIEEESASSAS